MAQGTAAQSKKLHRQLFCNRAEGTMEAISSLGTSIKTVLGSGRDIVGAHHSAGYHGVPAPALWDLLETIQLNAAVSDVSYGWNWSRDRQFSVASAYMGRCSSVPRDAFNLGAKEIWKTSTAPPKVKFSFG